jgi:phage-related protein
MIDAIIRNFPKFIDAGLKLMLKMAEGLVKGFQSVLQKFPSFGSKMVGALTSFIGQFGNVGKNLIKGLWNGISNVTGWIIGKIRGFGSSVLKAIKGIFGVHSPSTEFYWIGKMNMVGFENAIDDMKPQIQKTIDSVFDLQPNVSGSMQSTYSPQMTVNVQNNMELDPLGQLVNNIKTFSGGAKNDYNWGASL